MDEIAKMLIATSPIAAVVLLLGNTALQIIRDDLRAASDKRDIIIKRLEAIETKLGITYPPQ